MKNLEQADVFVVNGAGMESFLDKVTSQLPSFQSLIPARGFGSLRAARTAPTSMKRMDTSIPRTMGTITGR